GTEMFAVNIETRDFSISVSDNSKAIKPGGSASFEIDVRGIGSFSEAVSLETSISPSSPDISTMLSSTMTPPGSKSLLTVTAGAAASAATFTITVTGRAGQLVKTATVTVAVNVEAKDFTLSVDPSSQIISQGESASFVLDVRSIGDFSETVILGANVSPPDPNVSISLSSTSIKPGAGATLTVATSVGIRPSVFSITILGISGQLAPKTVTVTVTIVAKGFSLTVDPTSQSIAAGDRADF